MHMAEPNISRVQLDDANSASKEGESRTGDVNINVGKMDSTECDESSRGRPASLSPLPRCTEAEKSEAMALIMEIMALDIDLNPAELVQAGIRADVVRLCYRELGLSTNAIEEFDGSSASHKERVTKKKSKAREAKRKEQTTTSHIGPVPSTSATAPRNERDQKLMELQHRTAVLEEQHRMLQQQQQEQRRADSNKLPSPTSGHDSTPPLEPAADSVEAMRRAAMASMKRKRQPPANAGTELSGSLLSSRSHDPPVDAPRAPRQHLVQSRRYRDVDAPTSSEQGAEAEAALALLQNDSPVASDGSDLRQARRANLYYGDDFVDGIEAPSGQVDYSAPLPTLGLHQSRPSTLSLRDAEMPTSSAPSSAREHGRFSFHNGRESSDSAPRRPRRRQPFIPIQNHHHRMVLDFSDDSSEEEEIANRSEDSQFNKRRRQIRAANTSVILAAWRKERGLEEDSSAPMSPVTPGTPASTSMRARQTLDAETLLRKKEQEIEALKERMLQLERKRLRPEVTISQSGRVSPAKMTLSQVNASRKEEEADQEKREELIPSQGGKEGHAIALDAESKTDKVTDNVYRQKVLQSWNEPFSLPNAATSPMQDHGGAQEPSSSDFPAYESLFSRHPGLRSLLGS